MTKQQKIILAVLTTIAMVIMAILGCSIVFLLVRVPVSEPGSTPEAEVIVQQVSPAPQFTLSPTLTSLPAATGTPTQTPEPTPTGTRVVTVTVLPTPSPTPVNCINKINNFEASGLITNEQVQQYLRQTIPVAHLDRCRVIEYRSRLVTSHSTPVAGSFTPLFREIHVFAVDQQFQGTEELMDTLIHEIGHNVHYNLRRDNAEAAIAWSALYKQSQDTFAHEGRGFVSVYAQTNEFEDFAESYMAYVHDPERLKLYSPDKYEFLQQEIFNR